MRSLRLPSLLVLVALPLLTTLQPAHATQAVKSGCQYQQPVDASLLPAAEPSLARQDQERAAADLLASLVAGHSDVYAGASVDWSTPAIDLWVLPAATELRGKILSSSGWFRIHDATQSQDAMRTLNDQITPDSPAFTQAGTSLSSTYEDPATGCIGIGISPFTPPAADSIRNYYGPDRVSVFSEARSEPASTRLADSAPFNGGDYTDSTNGLNCTTGLPAADSSTTYLFSAAHCFPLHATVYNGSTLNSSTLSNTIGTVVTRDSNYTNSTDSELIHASASALVWGSGTTRRVVKGVHSALAGEYVCFSGAYENERCSAKIINTSVKRVFTDTVSGSTVTSYQVEAQRTGYVIVGQGDSGGPVYQIRSDGNATGNGLISTANFDLACPSGTFGASSRKCGDTGFYVNELTLLGAYATIHFKTG